MWGLLSRVDSAVLKMADPPLSATLRQLASAYTWHHPNHVETVRLSLPRFRHRIGLLGTHEVSRFKAQQPFAALVKWSSSWREWSEVPELAHDEAR